MHLNLGVMRQIEDEPMNSGNLYENQLGTYRGRRYLWWDSLARTASSDTIRRYFVFLFLVPVVAAAISKLGFLHELRLPITLAVAYFAGVFLFLGAVLVELWCPDINRIGRTYAEFEAEGRTKQYIIQQLRETYIALEESPASRANHFLKGFLTYFTTLPRDVTLEVQQLTDQPLSRQRLWQIAELLVQHPPDTKEAFWHIQWFAASTRPWRRRVCFSCFVIGAVLALATLVFQAVTVFSAA